MERATPLSTDEKPGQTTERALGSDSRWRIVGLGLSHMTWIISLIRFIPP